MSGQADHPGRDWERIYDAEGYIELLDTFSGHIAMEGWQRDRLYGEIRRRLGAGRTGACGDTGARSCTWRAAWPVVELEQMRSVQPELTSATKGAGDL